MYYGTRYKVRSKNNCYTYIFKFHRKCHEFNLHEVMNVQIYVLYFT